MSNEHSNALENAASAYLRSARHQPIQWHEWGAEAFTKAKQEDKPVLLDIGAVWCHWCHVMDRESYENPATAEIINEHFIAIKVDRDERPDVDTRYQSAVSTISGQGGWPLTAFLTPEGKPYFGGTYFPPDDRYGRPGFPRVLLTMAEAFHKRRDEVNESAEGILAAIEHNEAFSGRAADPGVELLGKLIQSAVRQFDARNGGFGSQPKFPHSGVVDLLIDASSRSVSPPEAAELVRRVPLVTLQRMAAGGIYDQLAGGFHRYSVDEHWGVPHFEKMAYDNSELLKNYVHAFQTFVEPEFARVARDIVRWMDEWLSDRERGGFYASQDADDSLDDDGDYFTWSRAEAREALAPDEFKVAAAYYDLRDVGDMHHNPAKNVLHVPKSESELAATLGLAEPELHDLLAAAKSKLYAARLQRRTPYIDRTVYTGWNGMCISAYLEAAQALNLAEVRAFALRSLDRVLAEAWRADAGLAHVVAYGEGASPSTRVAGVLEDYAFIANAALDAWEATGQLRYFSAAREIADAMVERFYDNAGGGFFDTGQVDGAAALGVLGVRRKPLQDSPTPAGNPVAATVLLRLDALANDPDYGRRGRETVEAFAGIAEHFGIYAGTYGLALRRLISPAIQVCVIGEDEGVHELMAAATARYAVNKSVIRLRRNQFAELPPALAETLPHLPAVNGSFAVVCKGNTCLPPVQDADELAAVLNSEV